MKKMPRKKKNHRPRDVNDLEKIFYGDNKDGKEVDLFRKRRYLDNLRTEVMSPRNEDDFKNRFKTLGKMEKIPENKDKTTFDYKIDSRRLLFEVTSLNIIETSPSNLTRKDVLRKLVGAIDHILIKNPSNFPSFRKGGVIIYTSLFNFFSKFNKLLDEKLPKSSGMLNNNLDFIVFFHESASINNKPSWEIYPMVFYVKDKTLAVEFETSFQQQNCKFFLC